MSWHTDGIHLWSINSEVESSNQAWRELAVDERARAMRLLNEVERRRFVAVRVALRQILGRYLDMDPARLIIKNGPHGKPAVDAPLQFSLSHSGSRALVAVSRTGAIGIDIERVRPLNRAIVRHFSEEEQRELALVGEEYLEAHLLTIWTKKEAFLKGIGYGIAFGLRRFSVSLAAEPNLVRIHELPDGLTAPQFYGWMVRSISVEPGFVAALASEGAPPYAKFTWTA